MRETILLIGAGREAVAGIQTLKELGYRVLVSDGDPGAPGRAFSDDFIHASVYDPDETLQAVLQHPERHKIQGILTIACDATLTVTKVARYLGLPAHSLETAVLASDKSLMKKQFLKYQVPTPKFHLVENFDHFVTLYRKNEDSCVLKPVDSRGARGVLRLMPGLSLQYLQWAFHHARSFSSKGKLIFEQWVEGPQLSTESVIWDDCAVTIAIADRNYDHLERFAPFVIENGGNTPSRFSPAIDEKLNDLIFQAARALGIKRGTVKGDIVLGPDGAMLIELAARLSGGFFSTLTIPRVYDVNLVKAALDIALGKKPDFQYLQKPPVCFQGNRFLFLKPGKVKKILDIKTLRHRPEVGLLQIYMKEGDVVPQVCNHTNRHGVVFTFCDNRNHAIHTAEQIIHLLEQAIIIEPHAK